jgi:sugar phosphate isomerase/epimerase
MKKVYVQTASFSRQLKPDFHGSLEKIAAAGYDGLELFDGIYGGYGPVELKDYLDGLGLTVIGAHVMFEKMEEQLAYLPATGCEYVVCPGLHIGSAEEAYRSAELLNEMGAKTREKGMRYGYHNHNSDFDVYGGEHVIDLLIKNTDPQLVFFELDAGWAWRAGFDAAAFINAYPGRFELIHVKETSRKLGPEDDFRKLFAGVKRGPDGWPILTPELKAKMDEFGKINCKLGDGLVNVPELKKAADAQGTKAYIVEREYAYTGDIFTSLAEDCAYLKKIL